MLIDDNGIEMVKVIEVLMLKAYPDPPHQDKTYSIGYGHFGVTKDAACTPEQAVAWLRQDIQRAQHAVDTLVKTTLRQGESNALVSFVFNIGDGAFAKSTMLTFLNKGLMEAAANEFPKWNKSAGVVWKSLINRRKLEQAEFLGKGWRSAL
jgi:lysozyme